MKTGIFGGTFDPVHIGHIRMAEYALSEFSLDKVIFVPNGNPPHKKGAAVELFSHRAAMLKAAVGESERFEVSDYEGRADYSYSLDTMRHFRSVCRGEVYFIIGADSLFTIDKWHEYKKLLSENKFIVFLRNTSDRAAFDERAEMCRKYGAQIMVAKMPEIDVSSTALRKMIANGEDIRGLVDIRVMKYIYDNGLYGG